MHVNSVSLLVATTVCLLIGASAMAADKGVKPMTHVPVELKKAPANENQQGNNNNGAAQQPMTHFDPSMITPQKGDQPNVAPGKIPPSSGNSRSRSVTPPDAGPAQGGPDVTGLQVPDHLLDDAERIREGSEGARRMGEAQFKDAVNDLFGKGAEIDPLANGLGEGNDDTFDRLNDAYGGNKGARENAMPMPDATTPLKQPANAGKGFGRAPLDPSDPRNSADGAASTGPKDNMGPKDTIEFSPNGTATFTRHNGGTGSTQSETLYSDGTMGTSTDNGATQSASPPVENDIAADYARDPAAFENRYVEMARERGYVLNALPDGTLRITRPGRPPVDETQDPYSDDSDGAWARWTAQFSGEKIDLSLKNPNNVNPGDPDYDGSTPKGGIDMGDAPVTNPDPNASPAARGAMSDAQIRAEQRELGDRTGGVGPRPKDP